MIQAVKSLPTSPTQKLLLLVLADCHNEKTGQCNPSYRYIMEITGLSNKAVANNLKELRNCGSVTFDSRNGANTHYNLTPERYICNAKPVNLVPFASVQTSEPRSQLLTEQPVNLVPQPVNLVPKSSEPRSHKPVLTGEPELLAGDEKPKRQRKPKKESPADPRHQRFVSIFFDAYQTAFASKLQLGPKDFSQLSKLLKTFPVLQEDEWQAAIDWCYQTARADQYAKGVVHNTGNLAAFCTSWSSLVAYHQIYQPKK